MPCFETAPRVASGTTKATPCGEAEMNVRSPGRPKDLEKREAILDAAQSLFAERGIDGVPIEAIAARSGVSKVTVYGHFGDKATIFDSIVQRETERLKQSLCQAPSGSGLEDTLNRFGMALIDMLTQPCHLALDRAVSLEAQRNPDLGRRFFEAGPGQVRTMLTMLLSQAQEKGVIDVDDPECAAEDMLALWLGFDAIERRFCGGCIPDEQTLRNHVSRAVRLFLKATAPAA
jgi:TetR/AcrR family transcriptional repressor of mexJK operon